MRTLTVLFVCLSAVVARAAITLEHVAGGLNQPIFVTHAPGDEDRLFVIERVAGDVRIFDRGSNQLLPTPYLNLNPYFPGSTNAGVGLLGLAFHPDFEQNGKLYVHYSAYMPTGTASKVDMRVSEFTVGSSDDLTVNTTTERVLFSKELYDTGHNAGWIGFSPQDGYLYIATGDNGRFSTADPPNFAQRTDVLHGKLLRIDVDNQDTGLEYAIPADNPFVGDPGSLDEIWAYGLRNPWRPSFDRETGDLYIADVGWNSREEINFQLALSSGGENYGWREREGLIATPGVGGALPGATDPIYDYLHGSAENQGYSVTGGYVYRGPINDLQGHYFFADYVQSRVWSIEYDGSVVTAFHDWTSELGLDANPFSIVSFGEDALGNLYIVDIAGDVYMVIATVPEPSSCVVLIGVSVVGALRRRRR